MRTKVQNTNFAKMQSTIQEIISNLFRAKYTSGPRWRRWCGSDLLRTLGRSKRTGGQIGVAYTNEIVSIIEEELRGTDITGWMLSKHVSFYLSIFLAFCLALYAGNRTHLNVNSKIDTLLKNSTAKLSYLIVFQESLTWPSAEKWTISRWNWWRRQA